MSRKTHKDLGQSSLPLQLNKVKLTLHRHSFYFNYPFRVSATSSLYVPNGWKQFPYNPYAPEKS